jgi:hypothetical protein
MEKVYGVVGWGVEKVEDLDGAVGLHGRLK